jgi:C-3',4' desaturase CrtD
MISYDVLIVGAGVGGLAAGALLADAGRSVLVLEQHNQPGGCAATFVHRGYRFDAGATIGAGFQPGGPLHWLARRLALHWPAHPLELAWEYREGDLALPLTGRRDAILRAFPTSGPFWREQAEVADSLWALSALLLDQYGRSRPRQLSALVRRLATTVRGRLLRLATTTAATWLTDHGLDRDAALRRFIDAQLLISAQATAERTNGLFAALALDLPRQHPCRIDGGIGTVAELLSRAVRERGGHLHTGERLERLVVRGHRVEAAETDRGRYRARQVLVNGSDALLARLIGRPAAGDWAAANRAEWGAFVLHLGVERDWVRSLPAEHVQLIRPGAATLAEGDSLFLSASYPDDHTRAPAGRSALTVSTHTRVEPWWQARNSGPDAYAALKKGYTERALALIDAQFGIGPAEPLLAGTPVTYHRYTGRPLGLVGGYAQTSWLPPRQRCFGLANCTLVGDHSFPGQSLAGVTVGAALAADRLLRRP